MKLNNKTLKIPNFPGVYLMKNKAGEVIYIGKATSLKERLRSYFVKDLPLKTQKQMAEVADIETVATDSAVEALFLESKLIKKHSPKYNSKEKDDKSRIYVYFTKDDFPAIETIRETDLARLKEKKPTLYGPFYSAKSVSDALEIIRKIFPFRTCRKMSKKKCLYGYIGLCSAPCMGEIPKEEYARNVKNIRQFFEGKKAVVIKRLTKECEQASAEMKYELAAKLRDQINSLNHLTRAYIISQDDQPSVFNRIEGYDISNISGAFATGSMVVFSSGVSDKTEYRKFKIKSVKGANDVAMLKEVLSRRFENRHVWARPDLIIVDGGRAQVNVVLAVLKKNKLKIPVIGIAKGSDRKRDEIITSQILPRGEIRLFKKVRDEAHRFARGYYEKLHRRQYQLKGKVR